MKTLKPNDKARVASHELFALVFEFWRRVTRPPPSTPGAWNQGTRILGPLVVVSRGPMWDHHYVWRVKRLAWLTPRFLQMYRSWSPSFVRVLLQKIIRSPSSRISLATPSSMGSKVDSDHSVSGKEACSSGSPVGDADVLMDASISTPSTAVRTENPPHCLSSSSVIAIDSGFSANAEVRHGAKDADLD
jgi:hypothetical protein